MRRSVQLLVIMGWSLCLATTAMGQTPSPAATPEVIGAGRAAANDPTTLPDGWRYRWHEGRWWYYLPNEQWVYWNGSAWTEVQAAPTSVPFAGSWNGSPQGYAPYSIAPRPSIFGSRQSTNRGWVGGFYSSGGGYGSPEFGYGYGVPTYGPGYGR
jgi:hypothetical protein